MGKWDALDSVSMFQLGRSGPWCPGSWLPSIGTLGRTESGGLEEGADGLWWLIFPQQAGAGGKATHRGR